VLSGRGSALAGTAIDRHREVLCSGAALEPVRTAAILTQVGCLIILSPRYFTAQRS